MSALWDATVSWIFKKNYDFCQVKRKRNYCFECEALIKNKESSKKDSPQPQSDVMCTYNLWCVSVALRVFQLQ